MANLEIVKSVPAYKCEIFIGCNDLAYAETICLDYCTDVGLCVTVTPTVFTYRHGACEGIIVGLINYARFPSTEDKIYRKALALARILKRDLKQGSFTIQDHKESIFYSTRDEDQP